MIIGSVPHLHVVQMKFEIQLKANMGWVGREFTKDSPFPPPMAREMESVSE